MINIAVILAIIAAISFQNFQAVNEFSGHDRIPMQFGINGQPTWTASRKNAFCIIPIIALITLSFVYILLALIPEVTKKVTFFSLSFTGAVFYFSNIFHLHLVRRHFRKH